MFYFNVLKLNKLLLIWTLILNMCLIPQPLSEIPQMNRRMKMYHKHPKVHSVWSQNYKQVRDVGYFFSIGQIIINLSYW